MGLRVLMFGWEFPPHNSGGLGTACEGLTSALADQDIETIFVLPKKIGETEGQVEKIVFADVDQMKVRRVPALLYPYVTSQSYEEFKALLGDGADYYGSSLLEEVLCYGQRAKAIAAAEDFDVIHAHDWLSYPAGLMAKRVTGKPLVVHVHATEFDRGGGNGVNQQVYQIEKEGMHQADGVVTVSDWTKKLVMKHYGVSESKIKVVHNGIRAEEYGGRREADSLEKLKKAGNKIVLFVGRVTLQKGPDYFVRMAKRVLEFEPKTFFVVVGSGDMLGQTMSLAASLGIADRFIFPSFLRGAELNRIYQAADLYILPSVSEPFGITPLESLANGTPVMISKQSGVAEVVSHVLKVDFWDVDEMANQILAVFRHDTLKETLTEYGRQEVANVTWAKAAKKCVDFYKQLVSAPTTA
ncbi:MAG: glycosyltransferase family 4 protein [Patescibacteria group bacterium]|nr:glycosyltransferase family 4 protein [Patescibacteria group bacterium]